MSDTKADVSTEPEVEIASIDELKELAKGNVLSRHPASRFAFAQNTDGTMLFIDGEDYTVNPEFARVLCKQRQLDLDDIMAVTSDDELALMVDLYNYGKIYLA